MSTYREMAFALQTHAKLDFDDTDITIPLILYWIRVVEQRLSISRLKKNFVTNYRVAEFIKVPIVTYNGDKALFLPEVITNLGGGKEIHVILLYSKGCINPIKVQRTYPGRLALLNSTTFTKPSETNPYYYIVEILKDGVVTRMLRFFGIDCLEGVHLDIYATALFVDGYGDLDATIGLDADLLQVLYLEVYNLVKAGFVTPRDNKNDGKDTSSQNQASQLVAGMQIRATPSEQNQQEQQQYQE